jgi:hypothetical protein
MSSQQLSAHEIAKAGVVDRIAAEGIELAADIEDVNGDKELTEDQPDGVQGYRRRVEEAGLPDDVREATLREVGKLELTSDQSSEYSDIRTWLDTILELPWSTKTTDWMDLQGSREVEATLLGLIKPAAADTAKGELAAADTEQVDTEQVDTEQVDTEQVDTEQVDTAPARRHDDDTVELPIFAPPSGYEHPVPKLPESQERVQQAAAHIEKVETPIVDPAAADTKNAGAEDADAQKAAIADFDAPSNTDVADTENAAVTRAETDEADTATAVLEPMAVSPAAPAPVARPRRVRRGFVVAAVLLLLGCAVAVYLIAPGLLTHGSRPTAAVSPSEGSPPASGPSNGSAQGEAIQLRNVPDSGTTFRAVRIRGAYPGGANTFLRVQRWEGGEWVAFPVPTKTDESGRFTAYVQLDQPGRYQLRMLHPGSGDKSKTFVIVVKG